MSFPNVPLSFSEQESSSQEATQMQTLENQDEQKSDTQQQITQTLENQDEQKSDTQQQITQTLGHQDEQKSDTQQQITQTTVNQGSIKNSRPEVSDSDNDKVQSETPSTGQPSSNQDSKQAERQELLHPPQSSNTTTGPERPTSVESGNKKKQTKQTTSLPLESSSDGEEDDEEESDTESEEDGKSDKEVKKRAPSKRLAALQSKSDKPDKPKKPRYSSRYEDNDKKKPNAMGVLGLIKPFHALCREVHADRISEEVTDEMLRLTKQYIRYVLTDAAILTLYEQKKTIGTLEIIHSLQKNFPKPSKYPSYVSKQFEFDPSVYQPVPENERRDDGEYIP